MPNRRHLVKRFNVHCKGHGEKTLVLAHGLGCDQHVWARLCRELESEYRLVLFDYIGAGRSDIGAYDFARYGTLQGYADDVVELVERLGLANITFVGHSVSSMIGLLACIARPALFEGLVMITPSACYLDEPGYHGGFTRAQVAGLPQNMESQPARWAADLAQIAIPAEHPESRRELERHFSTSWPPAVRHFAEVTFHADCRSRLPLCGAPTLVIECLDDPIAPEGVAAYVAGHLPSATHVRLAGRGHCPQLTAPRELADCIRRWVGSRSPAPAGTAATSAMPAPSSA